MKKYPKDIKRLLTLRGWRQFFKILSKKEKNIFFIFLFLGLSSFLFLSVGLYLKNTEVRPAEGGVYIEGLIGSPRFINPVYALAYDVDRDLTELIYSGLMKYNGEGEIIPDLVKEYKVLENGKIFEFYLKENLLWQDSKPLTADDVIFTIKAIQNPSLKSPIRANWLGVKVEKISDLGIRFELKNPSAVFLENATLKILPKHIWEDISDQNFPLSIYNLKPIGSGPYKLKEFIQDKGGNIKSLELVINPNYSSSSGDLPYIPKIIFFFFENENELISAFNSNKIKGFSLISPEKEQDLKKDNFSDYRLLMPRYFTVFFNPAKSKILADKSVRTALNYGTNKEEIVNEVLLGQGKVVDSPILPNVYGFKEPSKIYEFNLKEAKQLLDEAGFVEKEAGPREKIVKKESAFQFKSNLQVDSQGAEVRELQKCLAKDPEIYPEGEITGYFGNKTKGAVIRFQEKYKEEILTPAGLTAGTGSVLENTRDKLNQLCAAPSAETSSLSFSLATVNQPVLENLAILLKKQWATLGVEVKINTFDISTLEQEIIRPRNYEMLLFGKVLGAIPDPFPFWHSSQTKDPGLNLASYENKEGDKLLEEARQTLDEEKRKAALEKFQNLLIKDAPAVFLYSPDYSYLVSKEIKGISAKIITDPSKRFDGIENWYLKTKRVWK